MAVKSPQTQRDSLPLPKHSEDDEESLASVDEDGEESIHEEEESDLESEDDDLDEQADPLEKADLHVDADIESDDETEVSGWADAIAKVLSTGKTLEAAEKTPSLFLSKAIKDRQGAKPPKVENAASRRAKKNEKDTICRSKPDTVQDRARERHFTKLATKGVVQLFNAVKGQQVTIKTKLNAVGNSVTKRDKVYKNIDKDSFLEVLSGDRKRPSHIGQNPAEAKKVKSEVKPEVKDEDVDENGGSSWKILRDDFMMGAKMKDWDKESESE